MARELEFDGFWEGNVRYTCDCAGCKRRILFRFDSQEEANDFKLQRASLKELGWQSTKVNGSYRDFCSEECRNRYIRNNTI